MDYSSKLQCSNQKDLGEKDLDFCRKFVKLESNILFFKYRISSDKRRASNECCFLISASPLTLKSEQALPSNERRYSKCSSNWKSDYNFYRN